MQPFILNRTDERKTKSVGQIVAYAVLFFVITRIAVALLVGVASAFYMAGGVNPQEALQFMGNPTVVAEHYGWWALPYILLFAPLFEECAFRLGLSFRKWHVTLGLAAVTVFFVSRVALLCGAAHPYFWGVPTGVAVAAALWLMTTEGFWQSKREKWMRPMMWTSAGLFGLVHLFAMAGLTLYLLPFALLICLMLAFAGAVFVYLRVNLGFWWAVGAHIINNLIAVYLIVSILLK